MSCSQMNWPEAVTLIGLFVGLFGLAAWGLWLAGR